MTEKEYYANIIDLSEIPDPLLKLVMGDWFDGDDIIEKGKRIDGVYIRIKGLNEDQKQARAEVLKGRKEARNKGGVRIVTKVRRSKVKKEE